MQSGLLESKACPPDKLAGALVVAAVIVFVLWFWLHEVGLALEAHIEKRSPFLMMLCVASFPLSGATALAMLISALHTEAIPSDNHSAEPRRSSRDTVATC